MAPNAETRRTSRIYSGSGANSRPGTGPSRHSVSRPGTQQSASPGQDDTRQAQYGAMQQADDGRPTSRLQFAGQQRLQQLQQAQQQHNPQRPGSRTGNSAQDGYVNNNNNSSYARPSSNASYARNSSGSSGHRYSQVPADDANDPIKTQQYMSPGQADGLSVAQQQCVANPLYASSNNAALFMAANSAGQASPRNRCASAQSPSSSLAGGAASPQQLTPRRTTAIGAPTTPAAGGLALPRPASNISSRVPSSMGRNPAGNNAYMASPRTSMVGPKTPGYQQQQQQQQMQQSGGQVYKQLPAGALSQDPVGPTLAAYLGASAPQHNKVAGLSGNANSRPGSGTNRAAAATPAGYINSRSPSRQQRQQPRPGSTAASAAAASVLYSPRLARPNTTSNRRPGSTAKGQQQQEEPAAGPLLSDYFRPPSAAAPGSVGLFGLPGMEPPTGLGGSPAYVKVPSLQTSWDATAGGLSTSLSSSGGQADVAVEDDGLSADGSPHVPADGAATGDAPGSPTEQEQQLTPRNRLGSGSGSPERVKAVAETVQQAPPAAVRPVSRGMRAVGVEGGVGQQQEQQGNLDGDARPVLLWSAAHEIDGRPVTRSGERTRPSTRGLTCA